jgi:fumarate hydratase class I
MKAEPLEFDFFSAPQHEIFPAQTAAGELLVIDSALLEHIAETAFRKIAFTFTKSHLKRLIEAALSPDASPNDRYVCACLLENAAIAAQGELPLCQDTGIANVFGWKDNRVVVAGPHTEAVAFSRAVQRIYRDAYLRFSTVHASAFFDEYNPGNNLPAQITLFGADSQNPPLAPLPLPGLSGPVYRLLFCAKGGGSSNKTALIQGTKALLNEAAFDDFLKTHIAALGSAACPPYTIAVVAGGLSPEHNLLALKLAACSWYRNLPAAPVEPGAPFRDLELEARVMRIAAETGIGAQFGGTRLALSAVVIRLPRHGASCPVSIGVSCSAHRNLEVLVTRKGWYMEKTVENPQGLPGFAQAVSSLNAPAPSPGATVLHIDSSRGIAECLRLLQKAKRGDRVVLSGKILVARDAAHARWKRLIDQEQPLPAYTTQYPICYAGPAETPPGRVCGSIGPTTAGRMDSYGELLMSRGAALITIAKGNRSVQWEDACKKYGGYYLGLPGGAAALIAQNYVKSLEVIDYPELGMEAVRLMEVEHLPAFVLLDGAGVS